MVCNFEDEMLKFRLLSENLGYRMQRVNYCSILDHFLYCQVFLFNIFTLKTGGHNFQKLDLHLHLCVISLKSDQRTRPHVESLKAPQRLFQSLYFRDEQSETQGKWIQTQVVSIRGGNLNPDPVIPETALSTIPGCIFSRVFKKRWFSLVDKFPKHYKS